MIRAISKKIRHLETKYYYIYFLINKGTVVYIGRTRNLENRLSTHNCKTKYAFKDQYISVERNTESKQYTHYRYIKTTKRKLAVKWETWLIKLYQPKYNIHGIFSRYKRIVKKVKIKNLIGRYYSFELKKNILPKPKRIVKGKKIIWNYNPLTSKKIYFHKKEYLISKSDYNLLFMRATNHRLRRNRFSVIYVRTLY